MSGNRPEHIAPPEVVSLWLFPLLLPSLFTPHFLTLSLLTPLCSLLPSSTMQEKLKKYTSNTRVQSIQAEMTYRCLELLDLSVPISLCSCPQASRLTEHTR